MFFVVVLVEKNEERQKDPSENLAEAFSKEPSPICEPRRRVRVHGLLENVEFHEWLLRTDVELAEQIQGRGCPRRDCEGPLYRADFPRKVRGLAVERLSVVRVEDRVVLWLVSAPGTAADGTILRSQFVRVHCITGCRGHDACVRHRARGQTGRSGVGYGSALDSFLTMRSSVSRGVASGTRATACGTGTRAVAVVIGRGVWLRRVGQCVAFDSSLAITDHDDAVVYATHAEGWLIMRRVCRIYGIGAIF